MTLSRITLAGAGLMMLVVGALHLIAPQMMMATPGITLSTVNHLHIVRAAYGGAYLGIAALFLLGVVRPAYQQFCLIAVMVLFSGFAVGRIVSIVADGVPVPLYLGVLGFELVFAGLAAKALSAAERL